MNLTLTPRRLTSTFAVIALCLLLAHGAIQTVRFATGNERVGGLVFFFSVGADTNLPTFYSAFAILSCAVLLTIVGAASRGGGEVASGYWYGLAVTFLFLALDEMLELHERLIEPMRSRLDTSGYFYYAWVIPYGLGLVVFVGVYVRFLMRVPRRTAVLFVVAGAIFVAGGLGLEMVEGATSRTTAPTTCPTS